MTDDAGDDKALSTRLIHHAYEPPAGFMAPQPGVFKASTVIFKDVAAMRARDWRSKSGYTYGLHGTPTTFMLEERMATVESGRHCLLVPSGLASIALVNQSLLSQGDEVLLPDNVYGPSLALARGELARWGITHRVYDPLDLDAAVALMGPRTRLLWIEAPGSVTMEFPPLAALAAAARERRITVAMDDTWGSGMAFQPFEQGADVVIQAMTKYPSGGGDVLMGAIVTRDDRLHERLKLTHMRLGLGVAGNDAEAVLRALPSLELRFHAQAASGMALAQWLVTRDECAAVLHPALPGAPGHENWLAHCRIAAGLFSVLIDERYAARQVDRFVEALRLFCIGYSWAGSTSLVVPYNLALIRDEKQRQRRYLKGHLVRFSIGLEAVEDLRADLSQALSVLRA